MWATDYFSCERCELRSHFISSFYLDRSGERSLEKDFLTVTDVSTTCAGVIFRVKVSWITSVQIIGLFGQLSRDVIGSLPIKA